MTFDIVLFVLFIAVVFLILFRKEILSLFKGKPKFERRDRDNKEIKRTPQKQKPTSKRKSPKTEEGQKEREKREKERRKADAKVAADQEAAREALAEKKAAKDLEEAKRAELARRAEENKVKKEAYKAKQRAIKEALVKKEAEEKAAKEALAKKKAAAERVAAKKAAKKLEKAKKAEVVRKELPKGEYSDFNNSRLLDMGLSQEDADTFVLELIGQIDDHIPQLEAAIEAGDYEQVEHLTHSVKGSASNLGTGGVSDVMTDFNAYCKGGTDKEVLLAHLNNLKAYQEKLKSQFS